MDRLNRRLVAVFVLVLLSACSRDQSDVFERVAILPANVLIAGSSCEWLRMAIPITLQEDFATSLHLVPAVVGDQSGAYQVGATEALRITIENRAGRFRLKATLTDMSTQRDRQVVTEEWSSSAGIISGLNALAKRMDGNATAFCTKNDGALEAFTTAAQAADPSKRMQALSDAIHADPDFGFAYIALADVEVQAGQDPGTIIHQAQSRQKAFTPLDQARLGVLAARASHAPLAEQANATKAVLQIAPNNLDALATLGTFRFLQNNATEGRSLMGRALQLNPGNANIRRQLAQGLIATTHFAEAQKILEGLSQDPAALPDLAICLLLMGDANRAHTVFEQLVALQPQNSPGAALLEADWLAISGKGAQISSPLDQGNRVLAAYSYFLRGQYDQAIDAWRTLLTESGDTDLAARAMLAAALQRAGKLEESRKILVQPFVPRIGDLYSAIAFSEMRKLLHL